jgi:hypothetical protein
LAGAVAALLPVLFVAGCGGSSTSHYTVSGKVTINGKPPVSGSTVVFIGPDNKERSGAIQDDGSYSVTDPSLGDNRIVVKGPSAMIASTPPPGAANMPGMGPAAGGMAVPKKYENPGNGLSYTVTKAKQQTHDLPLTP